MSAGASICISSLSNYWRNFRNKRRDASSFRVSDTGMKRNVLLVANSGNDLAGIVAEAASKTGRGVITAESTRQIFDMLSVGLEDVDITIVDICASVHSLAILEALSYSRAAPPVIALVEVDEAEATPIVRRHGAAACLRKPFAAEELARLIDKVYAFACQSDSLTCDKWGHVLGRKLRTPQPELAPTQSRALDNTIGNDSENPSCVETRTLFRRSNKSRPPRAGTPRNAIIPAITC
jgi:DNA-binding NarL/FixJ family response regulator